MPAHTYQRLPPRVFSAQSATQQHPDQSQDKQHEGLRTGEDRSESHRAQSLDPRDGLGHWKLATHESDYLETMGEEQELDACADDDDEYNLGPQTEAERTSRKHQLNRSHTEMQDKIDTLNLKWRHERHTVDHVDSVEQGPLNPQALKRNQRRPKPKPENRIGTHACTDSQALTADGADGLHSCCL